MPAATARGSQSRKKLLSMASLSSGDGETKEEEAGEALLALLFCCRFEALQLINKDLLVLTRVLIPVAMRRFAARKLLLGFVLSLGRSETTAVVPLRVRLWHLICNGKLLAHT